MRYLLVVTMCCAAFFLGTVAAQARGTAGYHPAGAEGGYHGTGNASGYHAGGAAEGGYHSAGAEGGYHAGASEGGYHPPAETSAYHPNTTAGYPAAHNQLPTDAGYGATAPGATAGYAHNTQQVNSAAMASQAAAVRKTNPAAGAFNQSWYTAHPDAWHASGWGYGAAWSGGSWAAVAPLAGGAAVQPIPYNYGANFTYQGNQMMNGTQPVASADQYYQEAATTAQSAPPANPQANDWTPLGVFALVQNEQSTPHYLMQLAVNKSGALAGNYCDVVTDKIQPVQGAVDKQSQRVAWTVGNNKNTVGEAGLYNLTQDEAPALIHVGPDKTQQWLLVRLKQSDASAPAQ